jgi:nucleoside-diphosphate-sugar epimerase
MGKHTRSEASIIDLMRSEERMASQPSRPEGFHNFVTSRQPQKGNRIDCDSWPSTLGQVNPTNRQLMKILITGAAGFIGEFVVSEVLRRGHRVIALVRPSSSKDWQYTEDNLQVLRSDLRQEQTLDLADKGIDVVLHLAAATTGSAAEQFQDTVIGARNLLNAARQAGIRRVVGISSVAVLDYLSMRPMDVIDEGIPVSRGSGMGAYATAKLHQESLFAGFGGESGHHCTILRPGLVYDESRLVAAHAGIIKGDICVLASHRGEVPTIEVRGLARAIANAAERNPRGCEVIHLVDDHLPKQSEYIAGLRRRGLLPRSGIVVPWRVLQCISWFTGTALAASGFGAKLPEVLLPRGFSARLKPFRFSNAKAKDLLGWTPGCQFA